MTLDGLLTAGVFTHLLLPGNALSRAGTAKKGHGAWVVGVAKTGAGGIS